jgi:hypothetical protein
MPKRLFTSDPDLGPIGYNPGSRPFPEKRSEDEGRCGLRYRIETREVRT